MKRRNHSQSASQKLLIIILTTTLMLSAFLSCRRNNAELEKTELFNLGLGKMEDELDLIYHDGFPFPENTYLFMRNGLFYISNSSLNKIMEFTSYGDILTAFYNPDQNPQPVSLIIQDENSEPVNKKAFPYKFNDISHLVVDSRKNLFVVDEVDPALVVYDEENHLNKKQIIRRFDKNGKYLDAIGYEGVGGTPFVNITSLQIQENDELVVTMMLNENIEVLFYNTSGDLVLSSTFVFNKLPTPVNNDLVASLDKILADPLKKLLYLKIDYFRKISENNRQPLHSSMIHTYNPVARRYESSIEIPRIIIQSEYSGSVEQKDPSLVYSFLGAATGPYFYLFSEAITDELVLIILDKNGILIKKMFLELGSRDILFKRFHMTYDGIISGLLLHEYDVEICWWKSDSFIRNINNDENR